MQKAVETNASLESSSAQALEDISLHRYLLDFRLWFICAAFIFVGILSLNNAMLYTPDGPRYLIWAKSLAAFEGFKDTSNPEPLRYVIHAPLYSLILAPLAWFFSNIIIPAKVLTIGFGVALIVSFYVWVAKRTSVVAALIGAFFLAINPLTVLLSGHVVSDIPFTVCVLLFFLLAEKMVDVPQEEKWAWLFVVVLTVGVLLREIGLTLLLASCCYLFVRKENRRLLLVFTIPMLFYMIWYFRNEVSCAGMENPSLRNMKVLLGHVFTGEDASIFREFATRLRVNTVVYLKLAKGLILFPQFLAQPFAVVSSADPMMAATTRILLIAQYPLILLQYGLAAWGVLLEWKKMKTTLLVMLFSFFYLLMVFLYPINDMRFLTPMIIVVLAYAVVGGYDLAQRLLGGMKMNRLVVVISAAVGLLISVPNVVWIYNYIADNRQYIEKLSDTSKPFTAAPGTPDMYVGPEPIVGNWIAQQPDSSMPVLARWKELTFWMNGRKLVESDPLVSLPLFEGILRDDNVGYIVALVTDPGIREFEFQMMQSKKFGFTSVYRAGCMEVIKVHHLYRHAQDSSEVRVVRDLQPSLPIAASEQNVRGIFRRGVQLLESGRPEEAAGVFNLLLDMTHGSALVALFRGIALEFSGHFNEASWLFDQLRSQVQAGTYIRQAWYHQMLIQELQAAQRDSSSKASRAMSYHRVSSNYWDYGFHQRAFEVLDRLFALIRILRPG